jgi:WD40 repeat protein
MEIMSEKFKLLGIGLLIFAAVHVSGAELLLSIGSTSAIGDGFESGDLSGWNWSTYGDEVWAATSAVPASATYAVQAGPVVDGASTVLSLDLEAKGTLRFVHNWPTSGTLALTIDGLTIDEWGPSGANTGNAQWFTEENDIDSGTHTIDWVYTGGDAPAVYEDAAYLDNIELVTGGHSDTVRCVAFAPDGTKIASGGDDGSVRIWSATNGTLIQTIAADTVGSVRGVAFSPDSLKIISGGEDTNAYIWNVASGVKLVTCAGHTDRINAVAYSHGGTKVLTGSDDETAMTWTAATGVVDKTLSDHNGAVNAVAFKSSDALALTGSDDLKAKVFQVAAGTLSKTLSGAGAAIKGVAFDTSGAYCLGGCEDGKWLKWETTTGTEIGAYQSTAGAINGIAVSKSNTWVLTANGNGTVTAWSFGGAPARTFSGHAGAVNAVTVKPNAQAAVTGGIDRTVQYWEINSGTVYYNYSGFTSSIDDFESGDFSGQPWDNGGWEINSATVASGTYSAVSGPTEYEASQTIELTLNTESGFINFDRRIHAESGVGTLEFSIDGVLKDSWTGQDDWATGTYYVDSGTKTFTWTYEKGVGVSVWANTAFIDDVTLTSKGHTGTVSALALNADGSRIVSGERSDYTGIKSLKLKQWEAATGILLRDLFTFRDQILVTKYSNDYSTIMAAGADGTAVIMDATSGAIIYQVTPGPTLTVPSASGSIYRRGWMPPGQAIAANFSSDGNRLLISHGHPWNQFFIYSATDGVQLATYSTNEREWRGCALSPSATYAVGAGRETLRTLRVWSGEVSDPIKEVTAAAVAEKPYGPVIFGPTETEYFLGRGTHEAAIMDVSGNVLQSVSLPAYYYTFYNGQTAQIQPDINAVDWSMNGGRIMAGGAIVGRIWSATDGAVIDSVTSAVSGDFYIWTTALNQDGTRAAVGHKGGRIDLYSIP